MQAFLRGAVLAGVVTVLGVTGSTWSAGPSADERWPGDAAPVMAAWFWRESTFEPDGYKPWLDMMADHSGVTLAATSLRVPDREVTQPAVREQIRAAAAYGATRGIQIAMDLDVRLARQAFREAYPDELQEMLRLREVELADAGQVTLAIPSEHLSDHYTHRATPYIALAGRLVRVFRYRREADGIVPETVEDLTGNCMVVAAEAGQVTVAIPCGESTLGQHACVMVSFTHLTPDVFAPHLLAFQRQIIASYGDAGLVGVCKDEWGFPPCYDGNPAHDDYWYSRFLAKAYAERTGGRDLIRDAMLMTFGERGREAERQAAINHFNDLCRQRNGAIEQDFYAAVKAVFGPRGVVATHPTWWPYPDRREFKKNGLNWWIAPRDYAQTDEATPYCVRTSLAKKWGGGVWYNMFYSPERAEYEAEVWASALAGGRIDYHPLYPSSSSAALEDRYRVLLRGGLMRADCRVRLLNLITPSPLDCPVAVVFGQSCAMNWAGPAYDDVGLGLCDGLWRAGYPADLIPSTEIASAALSVDDDGAVRYGPQRYRAVVLYHPEFEPAATAAFFGKAAGGSTALYRMGPWTRDFEGRRLDGEEALPATMTVLPDLETAVARITRQLEDAGVAPQARATRTIDFGHCRSAAPPVNGQSRLIDGTRIVVAGAGNVAGDPIRETLTVDGHSVTVEAVGLLAVRFSAAGGLEALAAGGLSRLHAGDFKLDLEAPTDLAMWRHADGRWQGVLQGWPGPVPAPLLELTRDWRRLAVPMPCD